MVTAGVRGKISGSGLDSDLDLTPDCDQPQTKSFAQRTKADPFADFHENPPINPPAWQKDKQTNRQTR